MSSELSILALFGLLVIVTVFLQVLLAVPQVGIPYLSSPRDDAKPLTGPAGRAVRAVENSAITLAMFAPAILLLAVQDKFTAATLLAAQIFLLARIAFVVLYSRPENRDGTPRQTHRLKRHSRPSATRPDEPFRRADFLHHRGGCCRSWRQNHRLFRHLRVDLSGCAPSLRPGLCLWMDPLAVHHLGSRVPRNAADHRVSASILTSRCTCCAQVVHASHSPFSP